MERFKAIIFDLDDTLYPEHAFVVSGFSAAADWLSTQVGMPAHQCAGGLNDLFAAGVRGRTFDLWLDQVGLSQELVAGMVSAYRVHTPMLNLYEDVIPTFTSFREAGLSFGLLTDGYADVQNRKIASLNIRPWFHAITLSDELGRHCWKPSPVPFQRTLDRLGVAGGEAVYVADNPEKDFLGARAAGLESIRLRRPGGLYSKHEPATPEAAPDAEIRSLTDAAGIFSDSAPGRPHSEEPREPLVLSRWPLARRQW
jgi:putative hydrolase of the HAD superfamily